MPAPLPLAEEPHQGRHVRPVRKYLDLVDSKRLEQLPPRSAVAARRRRYASRTALLLVSSTIRVPLSKSRRVTKPSRGRHTSRRSVILTRNHVVTPIRQAQRLVIARRGESRTPESKRFGGG